MASLDCTGLCLLASFALGTLEGGEAFLKVMNAKFGTEFGPEAIPEMGLKVLKAEREFNRKAGLTEKDDRLPEFFYQGVCIFIINQGVHHSPAFLNLHTIL